MSELKLPRLLAAAKEFNVGQDTLIDFLVGKGFSKDELAPMSKLSEPMYKSLQEGFQSDKVAKAKSDAIDLPKNASGEPKKKREDEDLSFHHKEERKFSDNKQIISELPTEEKMVRKPRVEEPVVAVIEEPKKEDPKQEEPVIVAAVVPVVIATSPAEEGPLQPIQIIESEKTAEAGIVKIDAPEVEGPKIIDKIDLSTIDSSTRPKKGVKKPDAPAITEKLPDTGKKKETATTTPSVSAITAETVIETLAPTVIEPVDAESNLPVIENIKADRLEGPKILGKINLPVDSDTRPKQTLSDREKRKRKRIPVDRKGVPVDNNAPQNRGPQQNTGGPRPPYQGNNTGGPRPPYQGNNSNNTGGPRPPFNRGGSTGGQQGGPNRRGPGGPDRGPVKREDKVIDQKQIQEKLRETQAKLAGAGGRGKSLKAKYRRAKREEAAESMGAVGEDNKLQVTEFISCSELANLMDVSFAEVIGKCMSLGIMVSINQRLDAEVIELVASEFGYDVEFIGVEDADDLEDADDVDDPEALKSRAPIVTIMGHVDHGKTSLLDYIRNANVVSGEAGGITQHIGAYEVKTASGKSVTFLDTPGHEAFTAMRARGAKVTDIAVIVVAADDAVMPQTREAISHAQAANVPMIFAVNKIDKDGANPQKIYEQLSGMNILVEEWGGKFQSQEISAKQGLNIDKLLEKILLEAELLELKANPEREANGTIIEATLDKGRGYVATVLVQNGTLEQGDIVVSGQFFGRVKAMFNERNIKMDAAGPSAPVLILGINGAPQAGEKFKVYADEGDAKENAYKRGQILREQGMRTKKHITLDEIGRRLALGNFKELNVIIKGDVDGSVEALSDSLQKLSTAEIVVKVIHKGVGAITETDITLANASDAIVIGFNVRPTLQAARLADQESIEVKMYSIIYNAIDEIRSAMEGMLEPKIQEKEVANVEIREVYKFDKATVAGCFVLDGRMKRDAKIRLFRDGILIYPRTEGGFAELGSLKRYKDDAKEVVSNMECGLTIKNFADMQVGDTIVSFEEEEVKRTL
ncbi:MAG: translation initiation factor IF-2 [Chitinophagaceae bacterium]